jgi:poly(A) polymerase/tRNA nucleotidyltransferase (CCA-adding enzyme)
MNWQPKQPAIRALVRAFQQQTSPLYVVGGVVRDYLLNQSADTTDIDLAVEHSALPVAQRVADRLGWSFYPLDAERDVARLVFNASGERPLVCDVATVRGGSLEADLLLRDFTVNALAIVLEPGGQRLVDVCGGLRDLEQRQLRRVTAASFADDPARLLRAVRFVHQLGFTLEEQTLIQVKRMSTTVKLASAERVRDELWKIFATPTPADAVDDLNSYGLIPHILPEVRLLVGVEQSPPHDLDVYGHTLRVVRYAAQLRDWLREPVAEAAEPGGEWQEALAPWRARLRQHFAQPLAGGRTRAEWLVWHALLHDVGKPASRTVEQPTRGDVRIRFIGHEQVSAELVANRLQQLRFARQEIDLAAAVAAGHMRPHGLHEAFAGQPISRRAAYRYFRDVGGRQFSQLAGVDTLLVALADRLGTYPDRPPAWDDYLRHVEGLLAYAFASDGLQTTQERPILDGDTLMERLHLAPGRQVGEILAHVLEAQAAGEVQDLDGALGVARRWLDERQPAAEAEQPWQPLF